MQRRGLVPPGGVQRVTDFQKLLLAFEPKTDGQRLFHGEALRQFNISSPSGRRASLLDNPLLGDLSVNPQADQLAYDQLLRGS